MKHVPIAATAATTLMLAALPSYAVELGGAAALDISNWTTNSAAYVQGTTDGFTINWENVITNTAAANIPNNSFDVAFETDTNFTIGHIFLYNETLDLSTLPAGGIQELKWTADFSTGSSPNWIPIIALTDGGTTTFFRSANGGNTWNGEGVLEFVSGSADSTFWVDLIGDPIGGIDASRGATNIDFTATTGTMQFGVIQWNASTGGILSPEVAFTTAIDQFDISVNEEEPPQEITDEKSSSDFPNKFNGDEIYDGISFINDWDLPGAAGTNVVPSLDEPSGILTVTNADNNGWIQQDNGLSAWETGVEGGGSWTAEVRVQLANDVGNAFVIWAANGAQRGILQINTDSVSMFGDAELLDTNDNTDDFHTFRMAFDAGFNRYFVWRDGVSLTPEAGRPMQAATGQNRFIIGDCCSSYLMTTVDVDYIRYDTTGSFAPGPDGPPLEFTEIGFDEATNMVTLTWRSTPGKLYAIEGSLDMTSWPNEVDDSTLADPISETTTLSFPSPFAGPTSRGFFRVRLVE